MRAITRGLVVSLLFGVCVVGGGLSQWEPTAIVAAQSVVSVQPFTSIDLHDGGRVVLRNGPTHRVTLLKGSLDYTAVTVTNGKLLILKCKSSCPRGYQLEMEVITPSVSGVAISDGGSIRSEGGFPSQPNIAVAVSDGGFIDIRSIPVANVTAAVREGGRILTQANTSLVGSVVNGGLIAYWGSPKVASAVSGGGAVTRGTEAEANEQDSDVTPPTPVVPVRP